MSLLDDLGPLNNTQRELWWMLVLERNQPLLRHARRLVAHETAFGVEGFGAAEFALNAWWRQVLEGVVPSEDQVEYFRAAILFLARTYKSPCRAADAVDALLMSFLMLEKHFRQPGRYDIPNWELTTVIEAVLEIETAIDPANGKVPAYLVDLAAMALAFCPNETASIETMIEMRSQVRSAGAQYWSREIYDRMRDD